MFKRKKADENISKLDELTNKLKAMSERLSSSEIEPIKYRKSQVLNFALLTAITVNLTASLSEREAQNRNYE